MLYGQASSDWDQDQESTSVQDIFTFTMNVCEGLMYPSEKSNEQTFSEEFNKNKYHNRKKYHNWNYWRKCYNGKKYMYYNFRKYPN